jgi:hypothetical protein
MDLGARFLNARYQVYLFLTIGGIQNALDQGQILRPKCNR